MHMPRLLGLAALVLLPAAGLLAAGAAPVAAVGPTIEFPGCGATLQDCVDNATPSAVISVGQDVVNETITINQSVTLEGAPGFRPRIDELRVRTPTANPLFVTVRSFEVENDVDIEPELGSGHLITLEGLKVDGESAFVPGVFIDTSAPGFFDIESSTIHASGQELEGIEALSNVDSGQVSFRIVGNRIDQKGNIGGDSGIDLTAQRNGDYRADVYNNVVWNVAACRCGIASGIAASFTGNGNALANVVGNTIVSVHDGDLFFSDGQGTSGHATMNAFNNILGESQDSAITVDDPQNRPLTFRAGHNDEFQNGFRDDLQGGAKPGIGNLRVDPKFVNQATGEFGLLASSPLIDRGLVCSPGGVADPDAAGHHRLAGASVDLGALERGAAKPTGLVEVGDGESNTQQGTPGADILCGYGGDDLLNGKGGNDWLDGGSGADALMGGPGADVMLGGAGTDHICGADGVHGNDRIDGGPGVDRFTADSGDVRTAVEINQPGCGSA